MKFCWIKSLSTVWSWIRVNEFIINVVKSLDTVHVIYSMKMLRFSWWLTNLENGPQMTGRNFQVSQTLMYWIQFITQDKWQIMSFNTFRSNVHMKLTCGWNYTTDNVYKRLMTETQIYFIRSQRGVSLFYLQTNFFKDNSV
jgi:hypothetical protein